MTVLTIIRGEKIQLLHVFCKKSCKILQGNALFLRRSTFQCIFQNSPNNCYQLNLFPYWFYFKNNELDWIKNDKNTTAIEFWNKGQIKPLMILMWFYLRWIEKAARFAACKVVFSISTQKLVVSEPKGRVETLKRRKKINNFFEKSQYFDTLVPSGDLFFAEFSYFNSASFNNIWVDLN